MNMPEQNITQRLQQAVDAYGQENNEEALRLCNEVLEEAPQRVEAWTLLGMLHRRAKSWESAIEAHQRAIDLDPGYSDAHNNLANVYRDIGRFDEAVQSYLQVLQRMPERAETHNSLAATYQALGRLDEAYRHFSKAISIAPNNPDFHWDYSLCLLLGKRYAEGWDEYEWRWKRGQPAPRGFAQPEWRGEPLNGRRLLVYGEQGFGDALQFLRYVPLLKKYGGIVILEALEPLHDLINHSLDVDELVATSSPNLPQFDCHIPLISLARIFGTRIDTIPDKVPYLTPSNERKTYWQAKLGNKQPGQTLRIGLVWAGNPNVKNDHWRSPRLEPLLSLLDKPNVTFYALQKGAGREDLLKYPVAEKIVDLGDDIRDFADTAAILTQMDLLITTDTSVAHLAGAISCETWLMLHAVPDWRWLLECDHSPWYPSFKLYRQSSLGRWDTVVKAIDNDLDELLASHGKLPKKHKPKSANLAVCKDGAAVATDTQQPTNYYSGINVRLLNQIPATAKKVFEVGCGYGNFGEQVKARNPAVEYYAMELMPEAAKIAATKLDHVFCGSIESASLATGEFDCIIFGDVLEHLYNPLDVLRKMRAMLKPDGCILCSVPNVQHHSILATLLAGDFQYQDMGLLDRTHIRFFTYASFIKLLLDAGFIPQIADVIPSPVPPAFFETMKGGLNLLKQDVDRANYYMSAHQYIFKGNVNPDYDAEGIPTFPISFIVPTNDRRVLNDNFMASPIFKGQHPHQIVLLEHQPSAAQAMETGIKHAVHDFVVYAHQDVYLPHKWDVMYCRKVIEAQALIPNAAIFGVYGARMQGDANVRHGCVMDRHWYRNDGGTFPAEVESLDELLIGFKKAGYPGADAALGYHLYGTDIVCGYRDQGKTAVTVDALCFHNSGLGGKLPPEFYAGIKHLTAKWGKYLPLATACVTISLNRDS